MKLFELKGTLRLYAENIDDAFEKIGKKYLSFSKVEPTKEEEKDGDIGEAGTDITLNVLQEEEVN